MSLELEVAIAAAKTAGRLLLSAEHSARALAAKKLDELPDNSRKQFVTEMDIRCELAIKTILIDHFPDYGVLGEEGSQENLTQEKIWVIDPLDGTISYAHGLDSYAVAVGLLHKKESVLGVVYLPCHNELFYAEKNCGAFCNHKPIQVSTTSTLKDSIISMGHHIFRISDYPRATQDLVCAIKRLRIAESCSQEMCYVACGRIDGFIRTLQPTYDYMMAKIIIEEAGGRVSDFLDRPIDIRLNTERNTNVLASNAGLHESLKEYLT
jgi:myo-inositol-1(or 4)-monophosphatase